MDEYIQFMLALQDYEIRSLELTRKLGHIPQEIRDLDFKIDAYKQQQLRQMEKAQNLKKMIRDVEQNLKFEEDQLNQNKSKLNLVKNQQEYKIFSKKIEDNTRKIEALEETLMTKLLELDEFNLRSGENASASTCEEENIAIIKNQRAEKEATISHLIENNEEIKSKMMAIRDILQKNYPICLRYYDGAKQAIHKMPAVVYLKDERYCGGCHLKLSHGNLILDHGLPFIVCESCARLVLITTAM
ncbi:MAG: hypothetical protein LBB11_01195 [Puniceicoccales bacterium]|jgi:predicted  nucleic acid-binding Zn-ribbon protein|nr:hypothetical protein [Puniceicoccales bacterium]